METIDGEILQVQRDDSGLKIQSDTSEVKVKLGDIETEFGLIHIIDSVLIWNNKWSQYCGVTVRACCLLKYKMLNLKYTNTKAVELLKANFSKKPSKKIFSPMAGK